jgi:lipid A 4'-phosphatase
MTWPLRTSLVVLFLIAGLLILLFWLFPELDLHLQRHFFLAGPGHFIGNHQPVLMAVSEVLVPCLTVGLTLLAVVAASLRLLRPRHRLAAKAGHLALMLVASLGVGSGLLVNEVFKNHWGRPRPSQIQEFGGSLTYSPPLVRRTDAQACLRNCSFTSGDASVGFALLAFAVVFPSRRRLWTGIALTSGLALGGVRMAEGRHFLSDVLFSGVLVSLATLAMVGLLAVKPIRLRLETAAAR